MNFELSAKFNKEEIGNFIHVFFQLTREFGLSMSRLNGTHLQLRSPSKGGCLVLLRVTLPNCVSSVRESHFSGLTGHRGQHMLDSLQGVVVSISIFHPGGMFSPFSTGVRFSKLCSRNQVMGGRRTHSVSALLLVWHFS